MKMRKPNPNEKRVRDPQYNIEKQFV